MFAVAMALWGHANPKGASIFPSAESVGTLIGASRKSVEKYRTALVELRMIELVSQGKGTGDSSRYLLRDPGEWRTVAAEFEAAMAAVPVPATPEPETLASPEPEPEPEEERVRVALRGAPNRASGCAQQEGADAGPHRVGARDRVRRRAEPSVLHSRHGVSTQGEPMTVPLGWAWSEP